MHGCAYEETFYLGVDANDADMVRRHWILPRAMKAVQWNVSVCCNGVENAETLKCASRCGSSVTTGVFLSRIFALSAENGRDSKPIAVVEMYNGKLLPNR